MTSTDKPVTRRSLRPHPQHGLRVVVTLGPDDVICARLERSTKTKCVPLSAFYDWIERRDAVALSGFDPLPCKDPFKVRNV